VLIKRIGLITNVIFGGECMVIGINKNPKDSKIRLHFVPNTWWVKLFAAIGCFYIAYEMIQGNYKTPNFIHRDDIFNMLILFLSKEPISWLAPLFMVGLGLWCLFLSFSDLNSNKRPNK
jgi:hypothetical protein